jgi:chemotaxis protein histidine kinase CheA
VGVTTATQQLLLATFADEARGQLLKIEERLLAIEKASGDARARLLEGILRETHSLKGAARAVELRRVEAAAHDLESLFVAMRSGEFDLPHGSLDALRALLDEELSGVAAEPVRARMVPASALLASFQPMVRDLARELAKDVQLVVEGGDTEIDWDVIERLRSPLTHMVRNCLDHGVEHPDAREDAGKPRHGTVVLRARQRAAELVIDVVDDGAGVDIERVRAKAVETGLVSAESARRMSEREALGLIFHPGLSTKDEVTAVSGRGVGMDVVRERIERLGGTVEVESARGNGTAFTLKVRMQ